MKKIFQFIKELDKNSDTYDFTDDWDGEQDYLEGEYYVEEEEAYEGEYYAEEEASYEGEYYAEEEGAIEGEYYAEEGVSYEGEYYAEEEGTIEGEYYAEEEASYEGEYYAEEEGTIEGEYYAEEEASYEGEYYAEEEASYEGEYYAEEEASYEGEYHAGEDENFEVVYYEDGVESPTEEYYAEEAENYGQDEDDAYEVVGIRRTAPNTRKKKSLWAQFLEMKMMDRVVVCTGMIVLVFALITGGVYFGARNDKSSWSELADVGLEVQQLTVIGEKGLLAVADAERAKQAAAELLAQQGDGNKEYDENDYNKTITISLNMTSVQKDLKIKFLNKETGKLVANAPFSVKVTTPDGEQEVWSDEDMDGIIYKKGITPGSYKVEMNVFTEERYANFILPVGKQLIEVKKDIAYKKVDVSGEGKTESEIDASKEDTKKNETLVESTLEDTVEWVESTSTTETYVEVSKNDIPDPLTVAVNNKSFMRVAYRSAVSPTSKNISVGDSFTVKVKCEDTKAGEVKPSSVKWKSSNTSVATVSGSGTSVKVTAVGTGTAKISYEAYIKDVSGNSAETKMTGACTVTVGEAEEEEEEEEKKVSLTLNKKAVTVYLSSPVTINAKIKDSKDKGPITAESSDTTVATVSVNNYKVKITGEKAGSAVITVKYKKGDEEYKATCSVTVKTHPKDDTTNKLLDSSERQLYVMEDDAYREAVYADYYTAKKFFIKGDVKYTGWQTIDGKVYFFTAAGEKVTGEQVIQGAKYNFDSDGVLVTGSGTLGIDVSKWNGKIDWKAVKNSGISYVIIRCGYRGSTQGMLVEDPMFTTNIKGATEAGLKVGVYFFSQAIDEVEAVYEASYVLEKIKNYKISYPVFLDVEPSGGRGDAIDKTTRTAVCKAFCQTIQNAGYTSGVYANKTWLNEKIDATALSSYKIWLAQYAATPTYTGRYDMWQYKSTGKVSGITGDVDMNLSYLGY